MCLGVCRSYFALAARFRRRASLNGNAPVYAAGRPHALNVARLVCLSSHGAYRCHSHCAWVFVGHFSLWPPGSAVGPLVASLLLPLCRALAPWPCRRPRVLRDGLTRQCAARGLVGSCGCTSTLAATCLRNPHFHGRRTAVHWWLRRGTATCARVLVGWLMRWIRAVVGRSQAGWAAAHATRP